MQQPEPTVSELFQERHPDIVEHMKDNQSGFWAGVRTNAITSNKLAQTIRLHQITGNTWGHTYTAALELLLLRAEGKLPTPEA